MRTQQVAIEGKERWLGTELGDRRSFPGDQCHTFPGGRSLAVSWALAVDGVGRPMRARACSVGLFDTLESLSASPYYLPGRCPCPWLPAVKCALFTLGLGDDLAFAF